MSARKMLDKMRKWVNHDPVMRLEMQEALQEFFAFYEYDPEDENAADLEGLVSEWFTYDRKTTRYLKTPSEVYLQYGARSLTKAEKEFYKMLSHTIFGMFEVVSSDKEAGFMRIKRLDGDGEWNIRDVLGSRSAQAGSVLFARVIPLPDQPLFTGWVAGFPGGAEEFKSTFKKLSDSPEKISGLKPLQLLKLWTRPVDWLSKGEFFCKTRLAGIWQKWCGAGAPFSALETAVDSGDHGKYLLAEKTLLENCPAPDQFREIADLLEAYWNLASGKKAGLKAPVELVGPGPGPVEKKYIRLLGDASFSRHEKTGVEFSIEENNVWLKNPASGENGLSPFDLIAKERKSRGHPYPEKIAYSMKIQRIESKASEPASDTVHAALGFMVCKNFPKAARLFEEALTVLKHDRSVSFRVLGNLGICYALMGEREKAVETLREALRHNPDYDRARRHLSDLESMSSRQYEKFLKEGPGHLSHSEWRG